ncbi:Hypothetical protein KLENKIAIHU_689 [Klenkia terrae]|uniref:IrrE N-terminal-like domain-containing protein n=2 Tax=Geodermatophilaceae TaxID=85030 RepID=A0A285VG33_9ACTN|nr:protein of unknown function [Blastococcus aggregatus]SSC22108.1 Hypothetical protein KLENKIAIHU_689 [Klenkia terrae]
MADLLASAEMIDAHVDDLLRAADAYGRFPTPVNDIIEAAGLVEVPNHELDHAVLAQMPPEQRALVVQALPQLEGMLDRQARTLCVTDLVTNENRRRFVKLHEVVHGALPHQQALIYADNAETLSPSTRLMFEREANYGAAHLLFQRAAFAAEARSLSLSVASVQVLAARYGSSIHAAFRRYAETHDRAVLVLRLDLPKVRGGPQIRREQPCSPSWTSRFGAPKFPTHMSPSDFSFLHLDNEVAGETQLVDLNGQPARANVEMFSNFYSRFALLWTTPARPRTDPQRLASLLSSDWTAARRLADRTHRTALARSAGTAPNDHTTGNDNR